jgi:two-component system, cell cycle sensor histidine kinase and response regulator CckA
VLGNASLALADLPDDSPAAAAVRDIEATARQAAELTRQLLDYSGRGRFVVQPVDLSALVADMRPLLATLAAKTATLRFELAPDVPFIEADAPQVRQVVVNLVTNASDALEGKHGLITVRTAAVDADRRMLESEYLRNDLPEGRYVALEVSDNGVGMAPDTLARLFDPFFTTKATGHGLGLSASLGIIRGHRGSIDVQSTPGRGTTFTVLFPVSAERSEGAPLTALPQTAAARAWRGVGTVLVVDDEAGVRHVAQRMLTRAGFQVREAADGREALAVFDRHPDEIVLVLLDLSMPVLGGEACLRELRVRRPDLPVILTSGYNEADAPIHLAGHRTAGFVQKPFVTADLMDAVRGALQI